MRSFARWFGVSAGLLGFGTISLVALRELRIGEPCHIINTDGTLLLAFGIFVVAGGLTFALLALGLRWGR